MATQWIKLVLRAWRPNGIVPFEEFFPPLQLADSDRYEKYGAQNGYRSTAIVVFRDLKLRDFHSEDDPWGAMAVELAETLRGIVKWLRERPVDAFDGFRQSGIRVDFMIQMWIDQNQLDLSIPASLAAACGALGIGIQIITNE